MIIFLYGPDTYRSRQKLEEIISRHKKIHESGLSLFFFEGADFKFSNFKDIFSQISMFGEKKLIVLKNVLASQDFKENFFQNRKSFIFGKEIILFYQTEAILPKDKFFNFLKTKTKSQSFELLAGEKLKNWLKKELAKLNLKIGPAGQSQLIQSTGNDLWLLSSELKKLAFFKKEKEISSKDVESLIRPKIETAIFKTIDAISQRNKKIALLLVRRHLAAGDSPLYLLSMINFQFRNILIIKDLIEKNKPYYSILRAVNLHPFVVKKSFAQANKFTFLELEKIYRKIFKTDLDIKTGKINPETALDLLVAGI